MTRPEQLAHLATQLARQMTTNQTTTPPTTPQSLEQAHAEVAAASASRNLTRLANALLALQEVGQAPTTDTPGGSRLRPRLT